ncbi:MAG: response regulator [Ignavibacteriaceae bacterium]|nr:response regulator [Ignavibacteriaceae bacterium]
MNNIPDNNSQSVQSIVHDLNNLYTIVLTNVKLLSLDNINEPERSNYFLNIENCLKRAIELTKSLTGSKIVPGKLSEKKYFTFEKLISEVVNSLVFEEGIEIKVDFTCEQNLAEVYANETEIYQVVLNLLVNSIQAINKKGTITVSASNYPVSEEIKNGDNSIPHGQYVKISVKDSGCGIPKENLAQIFDVNFSTKSREKNSGIGLSNVKKIVESHNGHITVDSSVGEWTEFSLYFPAKKNVHREPGTKAKILFADDDNLLRELICELLVSHGIEVVQAKNGLEAFEIIEKDNFDLIIIDYNMPLKNGLETIKLVRERDPAIPFVLSTGSIIADSLIEHEKLNDVEILLKPYGLTDLLHIIEKKV